ncbi:hypothetical protein [Phenylobacterium sp.]|uniref:hypothetical protein n=1 Tax=Phenylobacterium sp. TaxID=1871053 RepID=UPI002E32ABFD|nr:hypothetical protein [Phenylobacterium sp.]HEX2559969.1 hypothetical protein [Phenylobacterium sp.]
MPTYRVYLIDARGRVQMGDTFEQPDDATAQVRFEAIDRQGLNAELWQGGRLVRKLPRDKG